MMRNLFFLICFICLAMADTFPTAMGQCTLEIYGGNVTDIPEIVELIQSEADQLVQNFGGVITRPYSVYITSNMNDFYEKSKGPVPEWGIAVAKLNPDRAILKSPGIANISFTRMKEVIIHELNHIYMFRIPNYYSMPSWFKEGMAMAVSNEFSLLHKIEISKAYWQKQTIPLQRLQTMGTHTKGKIKLAYGESAAAIKALQYYYGEDTPLHILDAMRNGKEFIAALESTINEEYIEFQIKFEIYLQENYNWVFLLRSANYLYVILPIILVLGFIYRNYRNKLKLKQWEIKEELDNSEWTNELPN